MAKILCVDDTAADLQLMEAALTKAGHEVLTAPHVPAALELMERESPDLIVSDYRLPRVSGLEFLNILARRGLTTPFIISTAYATVEDAVSVLKSGAVDYVTKPIQPDQLTFAVDQALELTSLRTENESLRGEISQLKVGRQILGKSEALRSVLNTIAMVAPTRATVLLQGESGTGKELMARAVHDLSQRSRGPFVALNCAAIPDNLVESSLFGHEKGAFTGATQRVAGAFERAHGGTLLLDEISEMNLDLQSKLLRALQEHEIERVGGRSPIKVDVRVVATTNRDLAAFVRDGGFREDLFFRLAVVPVIIPPLRERREDIPYLAQTFAVRSAEVNGRSVTGLTPEAVSMLRSYDWPGNVRELEHAIERSVIMCTGELLGPADFALPGLALGRRFVRSVEDSAAPSSGSLQESPFERLAGEEGDAMVVLRSLDVRQAEEYLIEEALRRTKGNRTRASELLGINARTLRNKLNRPQESA